VRERRIAYVINHAAFFVSHRLPLAIAARRVGFSVRLFTGKAGSETMEAAAAKVLSTVGIIHRRTVSRAAGLNPFVELFAFVQLVVLLRSYRPEIVHCASPKGVLYGGLAARLLGVSTVVLAVSGLGYLATESPVGGVVRRGVRRIYNSLAFLAFSPPNVKVIVQNRDDSQFLISTGFVSPDRVILIPGSGVDLEMYEAANPRRKSNVVLFPARMLKDKGVYEFVSAVRKIKSSTDGWRFVMAGAAGYDNPTSVSASELMRWQDEGLVEWVGHVDDLVPFFIDAAIVCLPSYREGMPKVLLEGAAAGCAVITTDVPGCREAVISGVTGDLVRVGDEDGLASALRALITDSDRRVNYGVRGRERAFEIFSLESVVNMTMEIYNGPYERGDYCG